MRQKKRGQVSIFLILAAVILLGGIALFVTQEISVQQQQNILPEFMPVKNFVEKCMQQATDDGLKKIGLTGGYIQYPVQMTHPRSYLELFPGSGFKIPYWWYDGVSAIPSEDFIQEQLESYVAAQAEECINDFESLREQVSIQKKGDLSIKVALNEEDVLVTMSYPLNVKLTSGLLETEMSTFTYRAPVRLKKMHALAKKILEAENSAGFIERKTIDLLALASEENVPLNGFEPAIPCREKTWNFPAVKGSVKRLLETNLPYIKIAGTDISTQTFVPNPCTLSENKDSSICKAEKNPQDTYASSYFNAHYLWDIGQKLPETSTIKVGMRMANDFDRFEIRPRKGALLKSNTQSPAPVPGLSKLACFNQWHFTYDITYPVLLTVIDPADGNHGEFTFNYAFMINVDHTAPKRENTGTVVLEAAATKTNEEFCKDTTNGDVIIQTASGPYAVDDVAVTFTCGKITCEVGTTKYSSLGDTAAIVAKLPRCGGATLTAAKEGYLDGKTTIVTDNFPVRVHPITLTAIKKFPACTEKECTTSVRLFGHTLGPSSQGLLLSDESKTQFAPITEADDIDTSTEMAIITLTDTASDFQTTAVIGTPQETLPLTVPLTTLNNQPTYTLEIYLTKDEKIVGGYIGSWSPDTAQLADATELQFHLVRYEPVSATADEQELERAIFLDTLLTYSKKVPVPEFR